MSVEPSEAPTLEMIEAGQSAVCVLPGGELWPKMLRKIYPAMKALDPDFRRASPQDEVVRDRLEAIQLHACNHSGWVQNDAWGGIGEIHKLASEAIDAMSPSLRGDAQCQMK